MARKGREREKRKISISFGTPWIHAITFVVRRCVYDIRFPFQKMSKQTHFSNYDLILRWFLLRCESNTEWNGKWFGGENVSRAQTSNHDLTQTFGLISSLNSLHSCTRFSNFLSNEILLRKLAMSKFYYIRRGRILWNMNANKQMFFLRFSTHSTNSHKCTHKNQ